MYINSKMEEYAAGYHDGRMGYEYNPLWGKELEDYYKQGYENGIEDRSEQDERG